MPNHFILTEPPGYPGFTQVQLVNEKDEVLATPCVLKDADGKFNLGRPGVSSDLFHVDGNNRIQLEEAM